MIAWMDEDIEKQLETRTRPVREASPCPYWVWFGRRRGLGWIDPWTGTFGWTRGSPYVSEIDVTRLNMD